jgi:hypothetical protein
MSWATPCFKVDMIANCPFAIASFGESPDFICTQIWDEQLFLRLVQWVEENLMGVR